MNELTETIECPLCLGVRTLKRSEVLDRLGVKDRARVAQLLAEEVFRLLQQKHNATLSSLGVASRPSRRSGRPSRNCGTGVNHRRSLSRMTVLLVAHNEDQLRQVDRETRWNRKDEVWVLRTTREWLPCDLDVLNPLFDRMRLHRSDILDKIAAVADEVRRTFADLDRIEGELKKATKAITPVSGLVAK
ncbi:MAG TPA: hypothetical protein VGS27_11035 [Candidatus Sulfotelmatobacter sp.]|nr:hypothetical protein [Candidatus Sulfotelmatobacter sp.]